MSARSRLSLLSLAVGCVAPSARGQDAAEAAFRARYAAAEPELIRRYVENRRAVIEVTDYDHDPPTGQVKGTGRVEVVSARGRLRASGIQKWVHRPEPIRWGVLWSAGGAVSLSEAGSGYRVERAFRGPGRDHLTEDILAHADVYLPLSSGWSGWRTSAIFRRCDYFRALGRPASVRAEDAPLPDGRPGVKVTYDAANGVIGGCLLDPANHLAFVRSERIGNEVTAADYGPGPEGFPVPVAFRRWAVLPDGREVPRREVRFAVYERYTPTDDDFDLEKQFGIDPNRVKWDESPSPGAVPEKRQPPLLRRPWVWYSAGAVVAVVAALLVVRWRHRARRWWDDIPRPPSPPPAA